MQILEHQRNIAMLPYRHYLDIIRPAQNVAEQLSQLHQLGRLNAFDICRDWAQSHPAASVFYRQVKRLIEDELAS